LILAGMQYDEPACGGTRKSSMARPTTCAAIVATPSQRWTRRLWNSQCLPTQHRTPASTASPRHASSAAVVACGVPGRAHRSSSVARDFQRQSVSGVQRACAGRQVDLLYAHTSSYIDDSKTRTQPRAKGAR
jgi:hypothetical protein